MLEQFETIDEWARWKVLEVALDANEEIDKVNKNRGENYPKLYPILESVEASLGMGAPPWNNCECGEKECTCAAEERACIIISCGTEGGIAMNLNYSLMEGTPAQGA